MSTTGITGIVAEIRAEIGACRLCKGMKPFRKQAPECFGTTSTGYMLVGEAAGAGPRPFDDKTGQVLRRALDAVNDDRFRDLEDLFFLSQAVRCIPPHPTDKAKTRAPTKTECRTCRPHPRLRRPGSRAPEGPKPPSRERNHPRLRASCRREED